MASIINATTTNGVAVQGDNSGSLQLQTNNGTTAVTIDTSQNVGVGTSSPTHKLEVSSTNATVARFFNSAGRGLVIADGSSDSTFRVNRAGTTIGWFQSDGSGTEINTGTVGSHPFAFYTNNTERMRITSGGDLCIGTTSTTVTGARLTLRGTQSWAVGPQAGDSTFYVYNASSQGVYILNGGTSWASSSDERKKDIIEPITDATNKVSQLRAVIGKYKQDPEGTRRSFLIAQDIQKVLPEAVNELNDEDKTLGVQYTDVIPLLVAAIKELKAELDETKAEVQALKGVA